MKYIKQVKQGSKLTNDKGVWRKIVAPTQRGDEVLKVINYFSFFKVWIY